MDCVRHALGLCRSQNLDFNAGVFIHPFLIAPSMKGRVSKVQKEGRKGSKSSTYKKPRGITNEDGRSMATIRSVDALPLTKNQRLLEGHGFVKC